MLLTSSQLEVAAAKIKSNQMFEKNKVVIRVR